MAPCNNFDPVTMPHTDPVCCANCEDVCKKDQDKDIESRLFVEDGEDESYSPDQDEDTEGYEVVSTTNDGTDVTKTQRFFHKIPCFGIIMAVVGCSLISAQSLFVKLAVNTEPMIVLFYSFAITVFLMIPVVVYSNQQAAVFYYSWTQRVWLACRGVSGSLTNALSNWGARYIPLGDASVIRFSAPVFVGILGCILLNEQCGLVEAFFILTTLSGVILIVKPGFIFGGIGNSFEGQNQTLGYALSLSALCCGCFSYITVRKLRLAKVHYSLGVLTNAICGVIQSSILLMALGMIPYVTDKLDMYYILAAGLCNLGNQLLITWALYLEEAGLISLVRTTGIVWGFLFEIIILKELPSMLTCIGTLLVTVSVLIVGIRKYFQTSRKMRSKLSGNKMLGALCSIPQEDRESHCDRSQDNVSLK